MKVDIKVEDVVIPEGKNEDELWEIFEAIEGKIDEGDDIILDITHSFRYLPMLTLIALNYVRFLKNVKISNIVYGAMEALGPRYKVEQMCVNKRVIPIFNLTPFASLFDWTIAIERFLQTGSAGIIKRLGIEELTPLLKETRGEKGGRLRDFIKSLDSFSQDVSTCRAPNFKSDVERILGLLPEAEAELEHLKPFKPLFGKIKESFENLKSSNDITYGLKVTSWCLEKGLIQQGFTILRETVINYVIIEILKSDRLKKPASRDETDLREIAETMLNNNYEKIPKEVLKIWRELIDYRNDINHGGWREQNYHNPHDFREKLRDFIERFEDFLMKCS